MINKKFVSVPMDESIYNLLRVEAKESGRSVASQIRLIIKKHIDSNKGINNDKPNGSI
jgi:hypothetical protein